METDREMGARSWSLLCMHKAASAFVGQVMALLFSSAGFQCLDLDGLAFQRGVDRFEYLTSNAGVLEQPKHFFGPFRSVTVEYVAGVTTLRPIVQIRDPRDCLVSLYYSVAYSHPEPAPGPLLDEFRETRAFLRRMSVDEAVLWWVSTGYDQLGIMRAAIEQRPDAVVLRYEDMVTDFPAWIETVLRRVALRPPAEMLCKLVSETSFAVDENKFNHKRQVTPGDFRRKLSPVTQRRLTERFGDSLSYFGYPLL